MLEEVDLLSFEEDTRPIKFGPVVVKEVPELLPEEGPHPHAAMTVLPSTYAERPAIVSELQMGIWLKKSN